MHHRKPCPRVMPARVCPTRHDVRHMQCDYVVPVVHPSHRTNVVNHHYQFQHSFPHTESRVDRITQSHAYGPRGPVGPGGFAGGPGGGWPGGFFR